jgi:tetratricopeptide (TPR) repeat protein
VESKSALFGVLLLVATVEGGLIAPAQSAKPAAAPHPQTAADAAARKQLAAYMTDYRADPSNSELRDKIVELAKTLKPAPAAPQAARTEYAAATAQFDHATTPEEFKAVAAGFEQVAAQAPWWADAWLKTATGYAKANDLDNARRTLAVYRKAVREGASTATADDLQQKIDQQQAEIERQQFQQALQAFQSNPSDAARAQVIKLAQGLRSKPEIPDAVRELVGGASYAIKNASSDADFVAAANSYGKALQLAPWVPDYYFNQGVAYEKAKRFDDAIAAFNWYLTAAPNANDTGDVRERIGGLKYAKEKAEQEQRAAEAQARADEERREAQARAERERREAPQRLLQQLRAAYDGARYDYQTCDVCPYAGAGCGCNENEFNGANWHGSNGSEYQISFPGDGTILISSHWIGQAGASNPFLRGTPRDGTVQGIAWEEPGTHAPLWVNAFGGYGLDNIQWSHAWGGELGRPADNSQYSSAQRYCYISLHKK